MNVKWLDRLMLAALATTSWEVMSFQGGPVSLTWSDILITLFVAGYLIERFDRRDSSLPAQSVTLAGFMLVFLAVYLCGYFDLSTHEAFVFWLKGVLAWVPHALFVVLGVAHLARRGTQLYERAMRWLLGGIVICAVYGVVQLAAQALAGVNLDRDRRLPAHVRPGQDDRHQHLRPGAGHGQHLPDQRADRRPQPPGRVPLPAADAVPAGLPGRHAGAPQAGRDRSPSSSWCRC